MILASGDAAPDPGSGQRREPGDLRQAAEPGGGRPGDGLADRMLRPVFDRAKLLRAS